AGVAAQRIAPCWRGHGLPQPRLHLLSAAVRRTTALGCLRLLVAACGGFAAGWRRRSILAAARRGAVEVGRAARGKIPRPSRHASPSWKCAAPGAAEIQRDAVGLRERGSLPRGPAEVRARGRFRTRGENERDGGTRPPPARSRPTRPCTG